MELLTNETIITKSDSDAVTLTSHRVRSQDGNSLTSIMLDQVSGIIVQYSSKPILIIIAFVFGIAGLTAFSEANGTIAIALLIVAVIIAFMYLGSRKHVISIESASSRIIFHTKGMNPNSVQEFVNKVEEARFNYSSL